MTSAFDEDALRQWLADYLVTNSGCSPSEIDVDMSMIDLGLNSRDAVVLFGELSELLGRRISPVELWQHPSINDLARFLSGGVSETEPVLEFDRGNMDEPIAVIGLGCRFPGDIRDPEALWQFLFEGRVAVGEVPSERWAPFDNGLAEIQAALSGTTRWGSFLTDIDAFDAEFFEISPREAATMDPQQRLLLEVAHEALEHAGLPPDSLRRTHTGVFVGACGAEYAYMATADLSQVDAWSGTGGALSIIANRVSYFFDLRGPSVTVDTACSSSLVAVHLACQSLRAGDSSLAIAAGVNLLLSPVVTRSLDQAAAISPTGRCHAFDAAADGFVRGEGCGVAVLKRLADALRDGDRVLAVVRGSAVNQDGRSNGLMAPNPAAQIAVLRAAYTNAGVVPDDVDYVEAHGTGTLLGDPIEARALGTVLGGARPQSAPLLIGAVKSNLGHLEAAAGIAGFIKTVLSVHRGEIPANSNFQNPNPHIPFDELRLKVVAENTLWPSTGHPRRAGVSSFGFGGTNAHVVLEQGPDLLPDMKAGPRTSAAVTTLVVSGKTAERVASTAGTLAEWMDSDGAAAALADVAHTLNHHRARHAKFATVCARDRVQAVTGLRALAAGLPANGVVVPHDGSCSPGTIFVYSGQGSHWSGMGRQLLADEPVFAAAIDELEPVFVEQVGFSLLQVIAGGEPVKGDARVQPALMGLQLALTELWRSYGVHPDGVIGHSMGEVSAAVVAEALTVADGLRVIATRSRLMSQLAGQGAVGLLKLDAEATEALIAEFSEVSIAGYVSPRETVIAGPVGPVDAVIATVSAQNRFARRVNMEVASHTASMDPILPELRTALADLTPETLTIPFFSTVIEDTTAPLLDAEYWVANVRQPARFSQAVSAAAQDHATFIEISAHPILTHAVSDTVDRHHHSVGTLWRHGDDTVSFHTNLNAVHTSHPPQTPHPAEPHPVLPTTPWHHGRHWISTKPTVAAKHVQPGRQSGAQSDGPVPPEWYCELAWPARGLSGEQSGADSWWLVVADSELGAGIGRVLGDDSRVAVLPPLLLAEETPEAALTDALAGVTHVLYAPQVSSRTFDAEAGYALFNAARRLTDAVTAMGMGPRLLLLTRNAQVVDEGDRADPAHAVLWGFGRTLALEHPEIWGGVVDVDDSVSAAVAAQYLVAEAHGGDGEDQVVYRGGIRRVPRLRRRYPPSTTPVDFNGGSSHLVVGATGRIGPHLIRQLADKGACTIVAVSRNPGSRLDELAASLSATGTTLVTVAADAADETAMSALFDRFGADLPPLGGIYVAAFGGGPKTLRDMTDDDVTAMFRPKLDVAALLHKLSSPHPVRQFVMFSSISGVIGSRWLAHYAATTTFLETFACARRAAGLPATAISWGLWKSLLDSESDEERRVILDSGLESMRDEVAIQALPWVIGPGASVRSIIVAADWPRLAAAYRTRAALHIVDDLLLSEDREQGSSAVTTEFRAALRDCEPARRHALLVDHVAAQVAATMGLASPRLLDPSAGFFQSGMDSLMSVTIQRVLSESLGEALPASVVFDYPTVEALADYLATILPELVENADQEGVDTTMTGVPRDRGAKDVDSEPIAVVGMACRLPGGVDTPAQYWRLLKDGQSGVIRVPADRWDADAYYSDDHTVPGTICNREGGFLTSWQPDEFDAEFFGISPREATAMDPQQRLLLEVAWEALENAGVTASAIRGTQTSVFVGSTTLDYLVAYAKSRTNSFDPYFPFGNAMNFLAGRLSYFLGVHGPAVVVDTACSSSLVAIHLACQSLRRRESDQALAAGVNLILSPENSVATSRWGMLAPDGRCKTFDAGADGYVRSEGCGVVVLKRLSDALRERDSVLAVVRGSAVNQDGPSSGQTVPNGPAQQAVLRQALAASRLVPSEIDYIEAHGTGTSLGDPIELGALDQVFGRRDGAAPLVLGSVKTNLGHLESAAGVAGFIKTVLSVQHGYIPRHLHFEQLTPAAVEGALRFTIAAQGMSWPAVKRPRRAGVSSFGVSGTNAHVVVEQAPAVEPVASQPDPVISTLVISGKTPARIASMAAMLAEWMTGEGADVALADVACTVNHHRTRHKHFAAVCARDRAQVVAGLQALAAGEPATGVVEPREGLHGSGTVFVYSGQGSQWTGMGQRLLADEPAFTAAVGELEPVFVERVGFSLREVLDAGEPVVGIERIQPVLVGMQLALTALWRAYGVEPDAVIGHSMGEVTAAVVAGALTPADGLKVIATRSKLMSRLSGQGAMALLELGAEDAEQLIADFPDITVAIYAAPQQTVIAGPPEQVDTVIALVDAQGRLARRVEVDVASHHPTVDPILPALRGALSDLAPVPPRIPLISTVGQTNGTAPAFDADYWVANLRNPVRFSQAVAAAVEEHGGHTFVEVSPHPLLTYTIDETLASKSTGRFTVTSAMKRGEDETLSVRTQLASLGATSTRANGGRLADVPPSPWLHAKYWFENPAGQQIPDVHPLLGVHVEMLSGRDHLWQAEIGTQTMPWLADHKVHGQPVMPTAAFVEMALAAGCQALGQPVEAVAVSELQIERALVLDRQTRVTTQLALREDGIRVEIHASSAGGDWRRYAVASVDVVHEQAPRGRVDDAHSEIEVVLPDDAADHPKYCIQPAVIDAALQHLVAAIPAGLSEGPTETAYLPVSVARIRAFGRVGRRARCHTELASCERQDAGYLGRIVLSDGSGTPTAELTGVDLRPVDPRMVPLPLEQKIFDTVWVQSSTPQTGSADDRIPTGSWLLLADSGSETAALVADVAARLSSPTRRVVRGALSDDSAAVEAFRKAAADENLSPAGVIVFLPAPSFDGTDFDGALRSAQELIGAIWTAAHAIVDGGEGSPSRLWLVGRDGLSVHDGEPGDPAIGALKGLIRNWRFPGEAARVLAGEPDLGTTLVDLGKTDDPVAALITELSSPVGDDVIAWRPDGRYVERLARATLDTGRREAVIRGDGAYIVTGGLGGLGTVVTRWLVERGAGRIVLNGRREPSDDQRNRLAELAGNTEIVFLSGDIALPGVAERLVAAAEETGRPLRGVVHAAGITGDGLVTALTSEGMQRVWAPKVGGALRLHSATATREVDWWVGFSSMATLLGLPGQLAYTTANAWLDALMTWRRASGLPATAINWGQWSDVGMSHALTYSVLDPITPDEGVEALESLVGGPLARVGVGRLRLDRAIAATPEFSELGYFRRLFEGFDMSSVDHRSIADDGHRSVVSVPDWSQLSAEARLGELTVVLRAILARELKMSPSAVNVEQPFPELGLDSMMAMTLLRETQQVVGTELSANMVFNHPTIASLAAYLAELLAPKEMPQEDAADPTLDSARSVLDELFDRVESASAGSDGGIF